MKQIDWDIIERKTEGTLSPEEEELFQAWLDDDPAHGAYFRKVEAFHRADQLGQEVSDERVTRSWERFKRRYLGGRRRWLNAMKYVAAACVVAAAAVSYFLIPRPAPKPKVTNAVLARSEGATLTLSTGEKVTLKQDMAAIEEGISTITNEAATLNYSTKRDTVVPRQALRNRLETPIGGEYTIALEDGTIVYLGACSSIDFPVVFPEGERVVKVEGEAYFEVAHEADRPFIVETGGLKVEVLGTVFNVRDYADEDFIETTLISGKVKVETGEQSLLLAPAQQAVLDKASRTLESRQVNAAEYVDWKNGRINVRNQRLEDILTRLSKWYDVNIFFLDEESKDIRFYANVDRYEDISELLDKFEKTGLVQFEIKGNVLQIKSANP